MKKIARILILLFVLALVAAGALYYYYTNVISTPNSDSQSAVTLTIPKNASIDSIADILVSNGVIKDKNIFTIYGKLNPSNIKNIQAGIFNIPLNLTIPQVYETLAKAISLGDIKVTVLDGIRYDEVVTAVSKAFSESTVFKASEMTAIIEHPDNYKFSSTVQAYLDEYKPKGINLEGFLYPDTYYFYKTATAKDVIEKMISTLFLRINPDDLVKVKTSHYTLHDYLTVASYLEREANTKSPEEMGMVAGIIFNRLNNGVEGNIHLKFLQLDSTLAYPERNWKINTYLLKTKDTLYNTFMYAGLTPTPIDNPGLAAIHAAINPISNNYYYFIYDLNGRIYYATTLAQHEANVKKYL